MQLNNRKFWNILTDEKTAGALVLAAAVCVTAVALGQKYGPAMREPDVADAGACTAIEEFTPALMPWNNIGGCGAGGSGGGGAGGPKWVGLGVGGGLIDLQVMYTGTVGQTYNYKSVSARLSGKPHWKTSVGLNIPVNSKIGQVQFQTNEPPTYAMTGGLGDMSADMSYAFGMNGQYSLNLGLSFPTGQFDIKRGTDAYTYYLPAGLQNGSGTYNLSIGLGYSRDVENGIWLIDATYSHPFNMKLFTGENSLLDTYGPAYADRTDNDRFYYRFKPYGENDMGDYLPPSVSATAFFGYRGVKDYVHSFGVSFGAPLARAWMHEENVKTYAPVPDPDFQAWAGAINYGLEFSRPKYPIFVSVIKPVHDQGDVRGAWNAPDWNDLLKSWGVAVGVKSTMF